MISYSGHKSRTHEFGVGFHISRPIMVNLLDLNIYIYIYIYIYIHIHTYTFHWKFVKNGRATGS